MIPAIVYLLCAITCTMCAYLLYRGNRKAPSRLLFWSCLCFAGLTLNNIGLFVDLILIPQGPDLSLVRNVIQVVSLGLITYGLVWDAV